MDDGKLVGILTNRDVRFIEDASAIRVGEVMTSKNLVTVPMGTSLEEAKRHLHEHRIEKLLVVDENARLRGLITMKDIDKVQKYPNACKDSAGRLRVGAAIGIGRDCDERSEQLIQAGVDVLVLDSAHGHSLNVLKAIRKVKTAYPNCQLVAGNVANMPGLFKSVRFLTTAIASEMSYASGLQRQALFSIALVLFVFIMLINIVLNVVLKGGGRDE